jgi:hypothetical protein
MEKQVVLLHNDDIFVDLLQANLQEYDVTVIPREDVETTLAILDLLPDLALVICELENPYEQTAELLIEQLTEKGRSVNLVIVGGEVPSPFPTVYLRQGNDWNTCLGEVLKFFNLTGHSSTHSNPDEFIPIPMRFFHHLDSICCDVFKKQEELFDKIYDASSEMEPGFFKQFEDQKIRELYIPRDAHKNFVNFLSDRLSQKLEKSEHASEEERTQIIGDTFKLTHEEIRTVGLNSATLQVTETIINSMMDSVNRCEKSSTLLTRILNSPTGELYRRAHLISLMSVAVLERCDMVHDSEKTRLALTYAAYFHDIDLSDMENNARYFNESELGNESLVENDITRIEHHARTAAEMIDNIPEIPPAASMIVMQHHGSITGIGLPDTPNEGISHLSKLFMICEYFAHLVILYQEEKKQLPIFKVLRERFKDDESLQIIDCMEKSVKRS